LPVHSGLSMDVKSVPSLQREPVPGHCYGTGARGQHCSDYSASQGSGVTRKSAISVCAVEVAETVLSSKETVIGDAAVVDP
jgi:hypothetical protein